VTDWQGADRAILTVGILSGKDVADAFAAIRKAGTVVVTAIAPSSEQSIPIPPLDITRYQKRIQGAIYGASNPRADIPRQYAMYRAGQLKLDELISNTYALDDIEQGYTDLIEGRNIRGGLVHRP
jgi:S-(hydroxymethyl)glutathione dehydrogenase/alcohol dehydrogenase